MTKDDVFRTDKARAVAWDAASPETKQALIDIARYLGRITARAMADRNFRLDMDDPEVAREVMKTTFEVVFLSDGGSRSGSSKGSRAKERRKPEDGPPPSGGRISFRRSAGSEPPR